jgi:hypothetical protein
LIGVVGAAGLCACIFCARASRKRIPLQSLTRRCCGLSFVLIQIEERDSANTKNKYYFGELKETKNQWPPDKKLKTTS